MKNSFLKYTGLFVVLLFIFIDVYLIIINGKLSEKIVIINKQLNKEMLKNTELMTDLQYKINEQDFTYKLLCNYFDFEKISDTTVLFVYVPINSCSSCVERLFVKLGQKNQLKNSTYLIYTIDDLFISNTWKNQLNKNTIKVNSIPNVFNLRNKPLLFYVNTKDQQVKYIWENSFSPEMTDYFIENFITDKKPTC